MAVPKWHRSKSRQGKTRMHIFIKAPKFTACRKCAKPVLAHTLCSNCGTYRGREVIDVLAKLDKKQRKQKKKELARQEASAPSAEKVLSPEKLSKQ